MKIIRYACFTVAALFVHNVYAQWTLAGSGTTGTLSTPGNVVGGGEIYSQRGWFRNNTTGTGLYNSANLTGIYSPSSGMMAIYNNGNFTAREIYSNTGWFRTNALNTGLFNSATGTGIYSPSSGMMAIYNNGNLTIGNAPYRAGYKLFVDQGILTEKVKVAVAGTAQWADYVFANDYKLMPLSKVEQYIKDYKHLPNVPSAGEMVEEGNDLGKTTAKLLEKIEELTLYMIEMKKENEKLKLNLEVQAEKIENLTKIIK
ncbi:MAG: hypothetical protein WAT19_07275 [Ferruginibacter sp.]